MKKFIIKVSLFLLPILIVFVLLDTITTKGLKKAEFGNFDVWNDIISGNIDADIIINGDSRAWVHVSTSIIDSSLNSYSYNLGADSYRFNMQNAKFKLYEKYNKKCKFVIQIVGLYTTNLTQNLTEKKQLLPYFDEKIIRDIALEHDNFNEFEIYIPFYKYNKRYKLIEKAINIYFNKKTYKTKKIKGYRGLNRKWDGKFEKFIKANPKGIKIKQSKKIRKEFETYIKYLQDNNIDIIMVYPPELKEAQMYTNNRDEIINYYKYISKTYNIKFIDFSNNYLSNSKKMFYNSQHLNRKGSIIFTKILCDTIKYFSQNGIFNDNTNKILTHKLTNEISNKNYSIKFDKKESKIIYKFKQEPGNFRFNKFFIHIYPKDYKYLPKKRKKYKYNNIAFYWHEEFKNIKKE